MRQEIRPSFIFEDGDVFSVPEEQYKHAYEWAMILLEAGTFPIGISVEDYILIKCIEIEQKKRRWKETKDFLRLTKENKPNYSFRKSKEISREIVEEWKLG